MYRHIQETNKPQKKIVSFFVLLYKRKLPFCSLCILLHGVMNPDPTGRRPRSKRSQTEALSPSDLGLLNLLLAVSALNDIGLGYGADVAVLSDGAMQRVT